MKRIIVVLILAASFLVPAPTSAKTTPGIEPIDEAIVDLTTDYARAYERKDRVLLDQTLARGRFASTELTAFDNAAEVPFRSFKVQPTTQFSRDLASSRIKAAYPDLEVSVFHVLIQTALDIEDTAYAEDGALTYVRESADPDDRYDGWRIASKSDLDILSFFSPRNLWDEAKVEILRSEHFLLMTHPAVLEEMRPVLAIAERGYDKATEFWPGEDDDRFVIIVPATTGELDRLIRATIDLGKFVAFVSAGVDRTEGYEPAGPRLFVHLDHFRNYDENGRLEIVAHELIHGITRDESGPNIPVWVEEGLANTGGGTGGRRSFAREGPLPTEFPTDELFATGSIRDIQRHYDQAQVAIEVLIQRHGREGLARFYDTLGQARLVAGTDEYYVGRAVKDAVDWSLADWIAAWRSELD